MTCGGSTYTNVYTSSNNTIVKAATSRGYVCDNPLDTTNCATFLATPRVMEMVAAHFNCSSLPGGELENNDGICYRPGEDVDGSSL